MTAPPPDSAQQRFMLLNAARGVGAIVMIVGLVVWYTDLLRVGGDMATGGVVFAAGLALSFLLPKFLARRWRTPPGQ